MSGAIHIVAAGARTPVGWTAESTAAAVRAHVSRIVLHPFIADRQNENVCGGLARGLDPGILGAPRISGLARGALHEVLAKLGRVLARPVELTVRLALPESRPGFGADEASEVLDALRASVEHVQDPIAIEAAGQGHAGGLLALTEAVQRLSVDQSAIEVIGGVDSYYDFDTLDWLQDNRQLSNRDNRNGFAPGEAACFVALATESARHTLGLRSLGRIHGWGIGRETKLIKTDEINLGEALADAVRSSVRGLRLPEQAPDAVYCDINGERYRSEEWGFALLRVPETVRDTAYVTPVDCIGDVGAASGPLLCNLAAQAWARSYAPGPRALVWAGSESGLRAAVVLEAPSA